MDSPAGHQWFLRKHEDGSIFGPLRFEQLAHWASSAQVAPHDSISTDMKTWMKAPMLPELAMDWIAEVTSERLYGPTTLGAIAEFVRLGEIDEETFRNQFLQCHPAADPRDRAAAGCACGQRNDVGMGMQSPDRRPAAFRCGLEDRIRELEQALREERRALAEAEERNRTLESKLKELTEATPAS